MGKRVLVLYLQPTVITHSGHGRLRPTFRALHRSYMTSKKIFPETWNAFGKRNCRNTMGRLGISLTTAKGNRFLVGARGEAQGTQRQMKGGLPRSRIWFELVIPLVLFWALVPSAVFKKSLRTRGSRVAKGPRLVCSLIWSTMVSYFFGIPVGQSEELLKCPFLGSWDIIFTT